MATSEKKHWWRADQGDATATAAARTARDEAAQALYDLDQATGLLADVVAVHRDSRVSLAHPGRTPSRASGGSDGLGQSWSALSDRVDAAMAAFLNADGEFDQDADYETDPARQFTETFARARQDLLTMTAEVEQFSTRHRTELDAARDRVLRAPRLVASAEENLTRAVKALADAERAGNTDPQATACARDALARLRTAQTALAERNVAAATAEAEAVSRLAGEITTRVTSLVETAAKVRTGVTSVATRRDSLRTRVDRLPETMSGLRRRYTFAAWAHLDDVPQRVETAISEMDAGISALRKQLTDQVVDVPAAALTLEQVRAAARRADDALAEVTTWLTRLDEVSSDPEKVAEQVHHKTVDTRRFLDGRSPQVQAQYRSSYETLAQQADALTRLLRNAAGGARINWGDALRERDAVVEALSSLVNAARAARS